MQSAKKKEIGRQRFERCLRRNNAERLGTIAPQKETIQLTKCDPSFQEKLKATKSDLNQPGDVSAQQLPAQSFDDSLDQSLGYSNDNNILTNHVFTHCNKSVTPELTKDIGVQVKTSDILRNFLDLFPTDSALSTATGIESYALLDCIVNIVGIRLQKNPDHYNSRMSLRNKVVMTYVKLKQNITYSFLAGLFQYYTAQHCQRVFLEMIQLLSESLKVAIEWPSKEEISRNLPQCFEGFENTRAVIDCIEIFIQRPSKLCCQVICYSQYKKSETFKVMTAVTRAGNISYISNPYGGRVSDTDIFEQCDLKDLLEPGDGVMVERGFLIDKMCAERGWKLIRPPFLKKKNPFSKSESLLTCNIAKARVHVGRSNQRIKTLKILGDTMPVSLLPFAGEIFTIKYLHRNIYICATINLGSPILAKDKFMKDH